MEGSLFVTKAENSSFRTNTKEYVRSGIKAKSYKAMRNWLSLLLCHTKKKLKSRKVNKWGEGKEGYEARFHKNIEN